MQNSIRWSFTAAAAVILSGCMARPTVVEKAERNFNPPQGTIVFRLAEQAPENHPSAMAGSYFADLVNKETAGQIRIKVYYSGKLGNTKEVFDQLKFGGIALGRVSFVDLVEEVPSLEFYARQVIRGPENCREWIEKNTDKMQYDCQMEKLYPLAVFYPETRCFYSSSSAYCISSTADLSGIRIGTVSNRLLQNVLRQYGAVPVDIVSEDTYQSMRNGYMNVRESELSDYILSNDYRFSSYVTLSTYISSPDMIIMSSEAMNSITVDQRRIIIYCAHQAEEFQRDAMQRFYKERMPGLTKTKHVLRYAP